MSEATPNAARGGLLVCFGDLCADVVAHLAPAADVRLLPSDATVETLEIRSAGAAANCARAAAAAGARVEVLGTLGDDEFAARILSDLNAAQVGTGHIRHNAEPTGMVISLVRADGERTLLSFRGANRRAYAPLPESLVKAADCVSLTGYSLQSEESAETAYELKRLARKCALDPSYLFAKDCRMQHKEFLNGLYLLTPNLEEARLMTGCTSPEDCAAALRDCGVEIVVVTLGAQGCYVESAGGGEMASAAAVANTTDTTGAGDVFCGTMLAKLLEGLSVVEAARCANEAAGRRVCN